MAQNQTLSTTAMSLAVAALGASLLRAVLLHRKKEGKRLSSHGAGIKFDIPVELLAGEYAEQMILAVELALKGKHRYWL